MKRVSRTPLRGLAVTLGLGLAISCFGQAASASPLPYEFDPILSLTGGCNTSKVDPVVDPGCPYSAPPKGPTGAFANPTSIAIDSHGDEYVASWVEAGPGGRIDVFSPTGQFITELADSHGPKSLAVDSKGNLYVADNIPGFSTEIVRYSPKVYEPEAGKIEYGNERVPVVVYPNRNDGSVAVNPANDHLFSAGEEATDEFSSAAEGNKLLNSPNLSGFWMAVDAKRGRLYLSGCREGVTDCVIRVREDTPPYALIEEVDGSETPEGSFLTGQGWTSIGVDEETGHFFVDDIGGSGNVYEFDENYKYVSTIEYPFIGGIHPLQIAVSNAKGAANDHYLFVPSHPAGDGHAFAFSPPGEQPPEVTSLTAANVAQTEAELRAALKPNGGETLYIFEYTSQAAFEAEGFEGAEVAGEGTVAGKVEEAEVSAPLNGLEPAASYRFRIRIENGVGKDEAEAAFTTYDDAEGTNTCPNQALRAGASELLPDCRAYELVTPADPNGRAPKGIGFVGDQFKTIEASPQGGAVSFYAEGGLLPGTEGNGGFNGTLYRSERTPSAWTTVSADPGGAGSTLTSLGSTSPDQGYAFWKALGEGPALLGEEEARYVHYPDGHSQLVGEGSLASDPRARGMRIIENGSHIVFESTSPTGPLEAQSPPAGTKAVYDRTADNVTHVVSLLPGDETPKAGEDATYAGSSDDGAGIAFSIGKKLYLRLNDAVTFEVGESVTFEGVSEGGKRVFYLEGGNLFAFDTEADEAIQFTNTGNAVVVNVASGGQRAYFVSTTAISGENPLGEQPEEGARNLYLSEEGAISFLGRVTARDVEGKEGVDGLSDGLGLWAENVGGGQVAKDPSRTNPAGTVLLFSSRANLAGYDPGTFPELYRYDSAGDTLRCISCIPTKAPATGGAALESIQPLQATAPPFSSSGFVPNLSPDGGRAIFESTEALVSTDTDGVRDVYEWEEQGVGSCTRAAGCVYLLSSGHSPSDDYLYGMSENGNDVFFITADQLVKGDDPTFSIYDARVDGGFAQAEPQVCQGEGCKPPPSSPPALPQAAKPDLGAGDNVTPPKPKHCPRGKRKVRRHGKTVCVKKRGHHRSSHKTRQGGRK